MGRRALLASWGGLTFCRVSTTGQILDPDGFTVAAAAGSISQPSFDEIPGDGIQIVYDDGVSGAAYPKDVYTGRVLDADPLTVMTGHDPDVAAVGQVFLVVGLDFLNDNPHWQATHSMRVDGVTGQNLDAVPNALGGFAIFARHPHVVSWGDRWLAIWQRNLSHDDTIGGTTAAIVNSDGTTPGLIDVPLGWRPDVAVSGDRALFVAVTNTIASATTDLEGQIMAADGSFIGSSFLISAAPDKQLMPAVTWNGSQFVVAWEDKRNSVIYFDERTDVFGARVATDGTVLDPNGVPLANESLPEVRPALVSVGGSTLLAVSAFRPEPGLGAFRLGVRPSGNTATAVADLPNAATSGIRLHGARPNPAHGSTAIRFESGRRTPVSVRIFDSAGRLVRTLADRRAVEANTPTDVRWNGRDDSGRAVGSGVFFYELRSSEATARGKVVLLR